MKTVKILGMGKVKLEKNGVTRTEYFEALAKIAKWNGVAPYRIDQAIMTELHGVKFQIKENPLTAISEL